MMVMLSLPMNLCVTRHAMTPPTLLSRVPNRKKVLLTGKQLWDLTEDRGPWITAEHQNTIVISNVRVNEGWRETASL